ncbi:Putative major facilitator, sugar transporter, major facilitator superfamily [Septoria linicola]|uniref:Major facilitator, sugar transporter, major facilitator superfamily n=1 Tax=Septoria linicola TaxID=215465 RepID=A0A9Q9B5S7_9PEZI|nr:Putative major facilitator, sugar transporter, major facilitator superfamily [Septoria linicola]
MATATDLPKPEHDEKHEQRDLKKETSSPDFHDQQPITSSPSSSHPRSKWSHGLEIPEFAKLSGPTLSHSMSLILGCAFLMFGYDQGVLSAIRTLDSFEGSIPLMTPRTTPNDLCWIDGDRSQPDPAQCTGDPNTQAAGVAVYLIGCFLGAVVVLFYGEGWGRKSTTFWGSAIMIVGTVFQAATFGYGPFVAGRVIGAIGNGMVTSTMPTWQSECARPERRGLVIILSGALIVSGVMVAYWTNYGVYFLEGSVRWRFPIAFQSFFTILVMMGLFVVPDSHCWLASRGRMAEAHDILARLRGRDLDDADVKLELQNIKKSLEVQNLGDGFKMGELLTNGPSQSLRRTLLGVAGQFFQQFTGINLVTYYAAFVFENSLGFDSGMCRLLAAANGTEYFLAALCGLPLIERLGRRKLMLSCAFGMAASMANLAGTISTGIEDPETGAPVLGSAAGITATVMLFVLNTFFAIGWLGMTWLYPAEITSLRIRIQANALATCSNWLSNFVIVMITSTAFASLGYHTYTIFAVLNTAIIPCVYFFFPEPKGRSLGEHDVIFASAHKDGVNPVKRAKEMPKLEDSALEAELVKYFGGDVEEVRRRSSVRM